MSEFFKGYEIERPMKESLQKIYKGYGSKCRFCKQSFRHKEEYENIFFYDRTPVDHILKSLERVHTGCLIPDPPKTKDEGKKVAWKEQTNFFGKLAAGL